jgi:hypothetical protein
MPSNSDFVLLCKKFEDPSSGDINYPVFCQTVEEDYVSSIIDDNREENDEEIKPNNESNNKKIECVDVNDLISRIRGLVLANRIRIKEFFQDMDSLNTGLVTKDQFIRCCSSFGVSSIGTLNISNSQMQVLCKEYEDTNDKRKVNWKRFEADVESVFGLKNLEKSPMVSVAPTQTFVLPPHGTVNWDNVDKETLNAYNAILNKWKQTVGQRRIDCWPPFRDFDK